MRTFLAFNYYSHKACTFTNSRAIAGHLEVFFKKEDREVWLLNENRNESGIRETVRKDKARKLLDVSMIELEEIIENKIFFYNFNNKSV